jgi:hypothetical protein
MGRAGQKPSSDAFDGQDSVKNPVLPHGASSKEKAILAIHPRSSERGILAFSREPSGVTWRDT